MIPEEIDKTTADYTTYKVIFYFSALLLFLLPYMIVVYFYNKNFYQSMIIEFIGFFVFFFLHMSLYKNHNLQKTSLYFIAILIAMLVSGNLSCSVNEYGLVWNYFIPLASFYLLGSKQGVKVTLVFSIYLFVYIRHVA